MFLLDSRSVLVTATCPVAGQASLIANLRDQLAEFPNVGCSRQALAFSARAPVSVLGTVTVLAFSRVLGCAKLPDHVIRSLRAITASTTLDASTGRLPGLAYPRTSALSGRRHRNINLFPIVPRELREDLGPANPRLINIAEEPLPLRPSRFQPD